MIVVRSTARATRALQLRPDKNAPQGTSPLGDWYMNLVPTHAGWIFLFTNEQSLLSCVLPTGDPSNVLMHRFVMRVANLLSMIGVPNQRIEQELVHFSEIRVAPTASRRILGVMNEVAYQCQLAFESATPENKVSLSDLELYLAGIRVIGRIPKLDALELLKTAGGAFGPS